MIPRIIELIENLRCRKTIFRFVECGEGTGRPGQGVRNVRDAESRLAPIPFSASSPLNTNEIQCDEDKPSCRHCERNDLPCSLDFLTPMSSACRDKAPLSLHKPMKRTKAIYPFSTGLMPELSPSQFDTQTNELLHHWTTILYRILAVDRKRSVWRVDMPRMGLAHPFLLSGILAISALHLSTIHPQRKHELQNYAVAQEFAALPPFRQSMSNPTSETIHAIFAFAGSVVYYTLASSQSNRCTLPGRNSDNPHWFQMMRGLLAFLANNWHEIEKGPFGPLLDAGDPGPIYSSYNPDDPQLAKLEKLLKVPPSSSDESSLPLASPHPRFTPSPSSSLSSTREEQNLTTCREALEELRRVSALPYSPTRTLCTKTSVHMWPGSVNQDFVELIYEKDERALVIVAHYCVLLKKMDHIWYLTGLGQGLLENIWQELSEEWRPWIQWAFEQPVSTNLETRPEMMRSS